MANKEGFGAIFRNNNKQNEKSPDYTGSINIGGKEVKLSCWLATSKLGTKYFQVRVANSVKQAAVQENPTSQPIDDDDLPWD